MLSYAEQAGMTDYLVSIYDQIELELLENLIAAIKKTKYGGATEWRAQMLERMGWYNRRNAAIIADKTGKTTAEINRIFRDLGVKSLANEETLYQTSFDRGLLPTRPINIAESAAISQILDAAIANANSYLNLVNTTCEEAAKSAYMDVVNKAYIETATGIKDYNTAIRHAVNNLAKNGLTTVTYYRKDGKKINYPVDAAVRRNIMTSIGQTTGKIQLERAEEWGCNYMEVTSHFGARPSHAEWQGQVYMIKGSSDEYANLADATGYGTGDGLKGWNCRHDMYPFIPGISARGSFPIDLKENEREYRLTQQQRALEREVRQLRRECAAADGLGDKAEFTLKSMELKDKEHELKDFMKRTDRTQAARVSTAGYNRSVSGKVTWADRKGYKSFIQKIGSENAMTIEKYHQMRYNNGDEWKYWNGLADYLTKYPNSNKGIYDVNCQLKKLKIDEGIALPAQPKKAYILPDNSTKKDPYHIYHRMKERNITDDEVRKFMNSAKVMFAQWKGQRLAFYSDEGVTVITKQKSGEWLVKTVWRKEDFDETTLKKLEVINEYVK